MITTLVTSQRTICAEYFSNMSVDGLQVSIDAFCLSDNARLLMH